jgi:ABC-type multidrug transport system fused ATPase/permease subunit
MLAKLMHAPMSFFYSQPLGRIMNRFAKDQRDLDASMSAQLSTFLRIVLQCLGAACVIAYTAPDSLASFAPLIFLFFFVFQYFQASARELKRLDSISRSPIYNHFSECLNGVSTIRAYRAHARLCGENGIKIDQSVRMYLAMVTGNRWLAVRLELLGGVLILVCSLFVVVAKGVITPAAAGLSLSYSLQITGLLNNLVRTTTQTEQAFNAIERIDYYCKTPSEEVQEEGDLHAPLSGWPQQGNLVFDQVQMRYREDLPLVLKGVSFDVRSGHKVGVVGRTGAGKSSLFQCLFRLQELEQGRICVDGEDISRLSLHALRSQVTIIPQDPVLFSGSVRFNVDPFEEASDTKVWEALDRSHLGDYIRNTKGQLMHAVAEGGSNFSLGQRQLLCLARALLKKYTHT